MERSQIQSLIKQCAGGLFDLACAVSGRVNWDLSLPVGVIDARRSTPNHGHHRAFINSMVRASATIGHPLMRQFFERMEAMGVEQALKESFEGPMPMPLLRSGRPTRTSAAEAMLRCGSMEDATNFVMQTRDAQRP